MSTDVTRQLTFRLPVPLIDRVEECVAHLQKTGLDLTRADVVRLLLKHALDDAECDIDKMLGRKRRRRTRTDRNQ